MGIIINVLLEALSLLSTQQWFLVVECPHASITILSLQKSVLYAPSIYGALDRDRLFKTSNF